MRLKEGKKYLRRDGQVTGPLVKDGRDTMFPFRDEHNWNSYQRDGSYLVPGAIHDYDIVGEYHGTTSGQEVRSS